MDDAVTLFPLKPTLPTHQGMPVTWGNVLQWRAQTLPLTPESLVERMQQQGMGLSLTMAQDWLAYKDLPRSGHEFNALVQALDLDNLSRGRDLINNFRTAWQRAVRDPQGELNPTASMPGLRTAVPQANVQASDMPWNGQLLAHMQRNGIGVVALGAQLRKHGAPNVTNNMVKAWVEGRSFPDSELEVRAAARVFGLDGETTTAFVNDWTHDKVAKRTVQQAAPAPEPAPLPPAPAPLPPAPAPEPEPEPEPLPSTPAPEPEPEPAPLPPAPAPEPEPEPEPLPPTPAPEPEPAPASLTPTPAPEPEPAPKAQVTQAIRSEEVLAPVKITKANASDIFRETTKAIKQARADYPDLEKLMLYTSPNELVMAQTTPAEVQEIAEEARAYAETHDDMTPEMAEHIATIAEQAQSAAACMKSRWSSGRG